TAGSDQEGVDHKTAQETAHPERHQGPGGQLAGFLLAQRERFLQVSGAPRAEEGVAVGAKSSLEEVGPKAAAETDDQRQPEPASSRGGKACRRGRLGRATAGM